MPRRPRARESISTQRTGPKIGSRCCANSVALSPTETGFTPLLDGENAESEMRGEAVTSRVSRVAKMAGVRDWVNAQVRKAGDEFDVIVDGRDIGTVVFPSIAEGVSRSGSGRAGEAPVARAARTCAYSTTRLRRRRGRSFSGTRWTLRRASGLADAIVIDTTHLTQAEQIARIVELLARKLRPRKTSDREPSSSRFKTASLGRAIPELPPVSQSYRAHVLLSFVGLVSLI